MSFDPGTSPFRLRFQIENEDTADVAATTWQVYLSKNGGAYAPITTSSTGGVKAIDAGSSADGTIILTPRLTTPT